MLLKKNLFTLSCLVFVLCLSHCSQAQTVINTITGDGTAAYSGDGGLATTAKINNPYGVAVDGIGNVYIADYGNNRIRKIDTFGIIRTIAGNGTASFTGDGGPATAATINAPRGIAVDGAGNVYFSDYANLRIRMINTSGVISTIAGTGFAAFSGDGGPATAAKVNYAWGVAIDGAGNVIFADALNCRVRKINTSGIISTIAGTGSCFISGDGGPASAARLQYPYGVACDGAGNIYIADEGNNRIRKINASGIISTIAGSPTYGFTGDGGPSTAARLYYPSGIASDAAGNVYICDINNNRIREINTAGIINTIAGNGIAGYSGDGGFPTMAEINRSTGVAVSPSGKVYISDNNNNRIRIIHLPATHAPFFTHGHNQDTTLCPIDYFSLDSLLAVFDIDTGQTETWSLISPALHGIAVASYSTLSTGGILFPFGLTYTSLGYIGTDSFKVRITDGTYSDTTTVHITIMSLPAPGTITGIDSLCPGDSAIFADTISGGTWGTSNSSIATVTGAGVVRGIAPGANAITYSVTNVCGTSTASFPFHVRSTGCPNKVNPLIAAGTGNIILFPNPNKGSLSVTLTSAEQEEAQFIITNIIGEKVKEIKATTNTPVEIKLNVPQGIYFISAITVHGNWTRKIIKE